MASLIVALGAPGLFAQNPGDGEKTEKSEDSKSDGGKGKEEPSGGEKAAKDGGQESAGPQVKLADLWVLNFKFQKAGIIQPTEGLHRGQIFWYVLYQIENKTKADREAFISISARSNKNRTYANLCLPDIEDAVERRLGKPLWGKEEEFKALKEKMGKSEIKSEKGDFNYFTFKDGEVRDCIAVFNQLDPGATSIILNVEGLSNDLHLIESENAPRQIESRLFVVELERLGDEYAMNMDRFREVRSRWDKKRTVLVLPKEASKEAPKGN